MRTAWPLLPLIKSRNTAFVPDAVMSFRSPAAGRLPTTSEPVLGGVRLPPGRAVLPDPDDRAPSDRHPLMWATDDVQDDAGTTVLHLQSAFSETGLWPVVLQALTTAPTDDGRPWRTGEFAPEQVTAPDSVDLVETFGTWWLDRLPPVDDDFAGVRDAFGIEVPQLASPSSPVRESVSEVLTAGLPGRIGLVPVCRPADVPAQIGWLGATNYFDAGYVSAMLRSWEERFNAVLVRIGFDYLHVAVGRVPETAEAALAVAAEQFAFCPDQLLESEHDTVAEYAATLVNADEWYCWWD